MPVCLYRTVFPYLKLVRIQHSIIVFCCKITTKLSLAQNFYDNKRVTMKIS